MVRTKQLILLVSLFFLVSCNQDKNSRDSQLSLIKTTNPSPIVTNQMSSYATVKKIEKEVSSFEEIYDVAVVEGKKTILVVYKVKHMHRFKMKKIEKDLNKMLEEEYPDENFEVSSDYKIFLEAVRLNERIESGKLNAKKAEKRFNEIIKMNSDLK